MTSLHRVGIVILARTLTLACTTAFSRGQQQQLPAAFNTLQDVPLPGDTSRFDYESVDPTTHRLFIAHLGAGNMCGGVGLWTKADSVTCFDDVQVTTT